MRTLISILYAALLLLVGIPHELRLDKGFQEVRNAIHYVLRQAEIAAQGR